MGDMISSDTVRGLIAELRTARQELMVLRAVDATVNAFVAALRSEPPRQGYSPDIIWQAEKELAEKEDGESP
jgi:hypothetical protein